MADTGKRIEDTLERMKKDDIKIVELQFSDIFSSLKSTTVPIDRMEDVLENGVHFDGSSVEGFARIQESDMLLIPDPSTYAIFPWRPAEKAECRFICDVLSTDGKPFEGDPRYILKRQIARAVDMGLRANIGTEQEFDLFPKEVLADHSLLKQYSMSNDLYFAFTPGVGLDVRREMIMALEAMGMTVEMSHHECAAKQHEIDIRYGEALKHADEAITFRYAVKAVAHKYGLHATFMPKTRFGVNGIGMHTHQSLANMQTGKNMFYDPNDPYGLSELAYHYLAGLLAHVKGATAIFNPTVNSYKRIVPGYEAPCYISWARANRSALIRIPAIPRGRPEATRMELRSPDPSCSPYLLLAVALASGLDGIKNKLKPPAAMEENIYHFDEETRKQKNVDMLPGSLPDALAELSRDKVVQEALGKQVYETYVGAKKQEWDSFRMAVTDWELDRYLKAL